MLVDDQEKHSKAHQVFDTYELLEAILLNLRWKDLLLAQRVSKSWQDIIMDSAPCQRALFFAPGLPDTSTGGETEQPALRDILGNPLLASDWCYTPTHKIKRFRLARPGTMKLNEESSCYKMLLLSPQWQATASPVIAWGSIRPPWRDRKKAPVGKMATYRDVLDGLRGAGISFNGSADAVVEISVEVPMEEWRSERPSHVVCGRLRSGMEMSGMILNLELWWRAASVGAHGVGVAFCRS